MKNGVWNPYEIRAEDSERLYCGEGGICAILEFRLIDGEEDRQRAVYFYRNRMNKLEKYRKDNRG